MAAWRPRAMARVASLGLPGARSSTRRPFLLNGSLLVVALGLWALRHAELPLGAFTSGAPYGLRAHRTGARGAVHRHATPALVDEVVSEGDLVTVEYTARLESGDVVDSSEEGSPLKFVAGGGSVLRGLSDGVVGLPLRELTELKLEPAMAYGERDESRVMKVPAQNLPTGAKVGSKIMVAAPGVIPGRSSGIPAVIRDLGGEDGTAILDLNHPLAGHSLLFQLVVTSRAEPRIVEEGDLVSVQYRALLTEDDGGSLVDESAPNQPLEFVAGGTGAVLPGLSRKAAGLLMGKRTELLLEPEECYGAWDKANVVQVPREQMPTGRELEVGMSLTLQVDGQAAPAVISELSEDTVSLDMNAPLAGRKLRLEVEVVKVVPKEKVDDLGAGLVMETTKPGDKESYPQAGQTAVVHYVGVLPNGDVFKSTPDDGEPLRLLLDGTPAQFGVDEAVRRMSVGQRSVLRVASSRGFGPAGSEDGKVPPNSDLRLFLELLAVE